MGCDIHFVIEKEKTTTDDDGELVGTGEWIGVFATGDSPLIFTSRESASKEAAIPMNLFNRWPVLKERNYEFFARLAGVRGAGPEPKGLPANLSELAEYCSETWGGDGHSHSWDTLESFVRTWLAATNEELAADSVVKTLNGEEQTIVAHVAGVWPDELKWYRVVYWFDN